MSTIDAAALTKFKLDYEHQVQQTVSKLDNLVTVDQHEGKTKRYTVQESLSYSTRSGRLQNTTTTEAAYNFRWLNTAAYDLAPTWDRDDEFLLAEMTNPRSPLQLGMGMAFKRLCDDRIIAAMDAAAVTGEDGTGSTAFPSGASGESLDQIIDVNAVETGSAADSNLTLGKIRLTNKLFLDNDVDPGERKIWIIGPSQAQALQRIDEYNSIDYNVRRGLMDGTPVPFMGFEFVVSTRLSSATGNIRSTFAYCPSSIIFNPGTRDVDYSERTDKRHDRQIYSYARLGAMRLHDEKVVKVLCDEDL